MFDLFRSRAKAVRYLLGAILILVSASMVITLIPGFMGMGSETSDEVIAEIGGEALTTNQVTREIQQRIRAQMIDQEMVGNYLPLLIDQMIAERAIAYEAHRLGFRVSDQELAYTIESSMPSLYQNGKFVGRDALEQFLSQQNTTIEEFENNFRKQGLELRLVNLAVESEVVTQKEVEAAFRAKNEKVQLQYFFIAPPEYRDKVQVSRDEMLAYYDRNSASYKTPEQRDIDVIVVSQSTIAGGVTVPEAELRRIYESSLDRFRTEERVKCRHILLYTMNKSEQEKAKAKAKAEDLLKQLKAGADFATLAKANSEDQATAVKGGELGWVTREQLVSNFANVAFALKPGELSGVVETPYGYHIIQVEEKEPGHQQTFDEVKGQILAETQKQYAYDKIQNLADQAHEELTKDPTGAQAIAQKLGLEYHHLTRFKKGDSIPALSSNPEAMDMLATLGKGSVSQVVSGNNESLVVATVTAVYPPQPAQFADVEGQIRNVLLSSKAAQMAVDKKKELDAMKLTDNTDIAALARQMGVDVHTSDLLAIGDPAGDLNSMYYFRQAYKKPVGTVIGPVTAMDRTVVAKVVDKQEPDMSQLAAQRDQLVEDIKKQKAQIRDQLFEDGVVTRLVEEGKVKINQRAIDHLVAAYGKS